MKTVLALCFVSSVAFAGGKQQQTLPEELKWSEGNPAFADVVGNRTKGAAQFFVRLTAGTDSGWHTHDGEMAAVVVTGTVENIEQGAEADAKPLPPGAFWVQPGKKNHITKCQPGADCLLLVTTKATFTFHAMTAEGKPAPKAK